MVDVSPIRSSLPVEDIEFYEILAEFGHALDAKHEAMEQAAEAQDFAELAELAHWLKGAGGTCGYPQFSRPAIDLENASKSTQIDDVIAHLKKIKSLRDRIELPTHPLAASS